MNNGIELMSTGVIVKVKVDEVIVGRSGLSTSGSSGDK